MPITLLTGPANSGKAEIVLGSVRRHAAQGRVPWLIVPRWADTEHYLRELAGDGVALGVRVVRFASLTDEVVRRARISDRALGLLARDRVIESLAAELAGGQPGEGVLQAASELIAELRARRVPPARFRAALSALSEADGADSAPSGLGALYADYDRALGRLSRLDAEQLALAALDELRRRPAPWGGTPVAFYGFDDLTPMQLDTIETLGLLVDADVIVSLTYEPGRPAMEGRASAFQTLLETAAEHLECPPRAEHYAPGARPALSHLERSLFEPQAGTVAAGGAVRLIEGAAQRDELELVAAQITRLLAEGMAAQDIALVARRAARDAELLEDVLTRAGVPFSLERPARFADSAIGRALAGLLRCVPRGDGEVRGELGDLLAWLRVPGLLRGGDTEPRAASLADLLEREARRRGIADAAAARALWEERNWPLDTIDRLAEAQARGPAALLEQADRELFRLFCLPRRDAAAVLDEEQRDEARALAAGRRAIAELRELARAARELAPREAWQLAGVLERAELLEGEHPGTGAVAVLDPLDLRARRVRALFVTGMQEGTYPAPGRERGLLSDDDRHRLATASGLALPPRPDQLAAERYLLYAVLSRPEELLVLSWHASDENGEPVSRSLFVDDVCELFEPPLDQQEAAPAKMIAASFAGGRPASAGAPIGVPDAVTAPDASLAEAASLELVRARVWSPSALEQYIQCPVHWFVERLLEPDPMEPDPEPFAKGGLAHQALNDTFVELRERTGSGRLRAANLALARELLAAALERHEAEHPLSVSPERRLVARRRLEADLERYLQYAAGCEDELEPEHLELAFGIGPDDERGEPGDLPALEIGAGVRVRGRIDRIDRAPNGDAVVIDYKSSQAPAAARWLADGRIQIGLYMRAVEQLLDARVSAGLYQPLSGRELRARGAVEGDSAAAGGCVRTDVMDRASLEELVEAAVQAARDAAGDAGRGVLTPRPRTCSFKHVCAFPSICRSER